MQMYFWILFFEFCQSVLSFKTEIRFTFDVPSLFRCKKNGPVFYFRNFPSDQLFLQTIKNSSKDCDLILIPANKRVIFDVQSHRLGCYFTPFYIGKYVSEVLYLKSNCLMNGENDLCIRLTPTIATIITESLSQSHKPVSIDLSIRGIGTRNIQIGDENQHVYSVIDHGFMDSGLRIYQVVFRVRNEPYLNMMCRYSYVNNPDAENAICRYKLFITKNDFQTRSGPSTAHGEGWSWLCYYYPLGVEQPLDYKMISKANEDYERASGTTKRVVTTTTDSDLEEHSNDSTAVSNQTEKTSSQSLISLLILSIIAGGIICICKYKCQGKSDVTRSSYESQDSVTSVDSIENDDD